MAMIKHLQGQWLSWTWTPPEVYPAALRSILVLTLLWLPLAPTRSSANSSINGYRPARGKPQKGEKPKCHRSISQARFPMAFSVAWPFRRVR